jgi:hypothetical protein
MNDRIKVIIPEEVRSYFRTHQNLIVLKDDEAQAYFGGAYFEEDKNGNVYTYLKNPYDYYWLTKEFFEEEKVDDIFLQKFKEFLDRKEKQVVERLQNLAKEATTINLT